MEAEEEVFRVRVSLERFFSDSRARCYMGAARARPARWLARRLRSAFPLPRALALVCRGHLLPPAEPLALLQPDDLVEVIPIDPSEQVHYKRKVPKDNANTLSENTLSPHPIEDHPVDKNDRSVIELNGSPETWETSVTCETKQASAELLLSMDARAVCEPGPGELEAGKQHALALLTQLEGETRARRRRVRRRRRAPAALHYCSVAAPTVLDLEPGPAARSDESGAEKLSLEPSPTSLSPGAEQGAGVVRAGSEQRAPRLVRALPALFAVSF